MKHWRTAFCLMLVGILAATVAQATTEASKDTQNKEIPGLERQVHQLSSQGERLPWCSSGSFPPMLGGQGRADPGCLQIGHCRGTGADIPGGF